MIARLAGTIVHLDEGKLIIDVNGVGYLVGCSSNTTSQVQLNQPATLYIETQVRQDHIQLFGFQTLEEQEWFNRLSSVQGVGGKVALALLSALTPAMLYEAIAAEEKKLLTQANGVGAKVATRIINELKDKIPATFNVAPTSGVITANVAPQDIQSTAMADAVSALTNLGYDRLQSFQTVRGLLENDDALDSGKLIADALKTLGKQQ